MRQIQLRVKILRMLPSRTNLRRNVRLHLLQEQEDVEVEPLGEAVGRVRLQLREKQLPEEILRVLPKQS